MAGMRANQIGNTSRRAAAKRAGAGHGRRRPPILPLIRAGSGFGPIEIVLLSSFVPAGPANVSAEFVADSSSKEVPGGSIDRFAA